MRPSRGEIWLVDFGEPVAREATWRRPVLVVSSDRVNQGPSGIIVVVPLTTTYRGIPTHVEIDSDASGLDEVSYGRCEDVRSISDQRLVSRLGRASVDALFAVGRAPQILLDL